VVSNSGFPLLAAMWKGREISAGMLGMAEISGHGGLGIRQGAESGE
jgi:hypothetical protein